MRATRAVSGRSVPIIAFGAAGAGFFLRYFGPESMGGTGDIGAKIDAEVARTGLSADEIGPKVHIHIYVNSYTSRWTTNKRIFAFFTKKKILYRDHTEGKVIRIPGLPAMYDYEFFPQTVWPTFFFF